MLSANHHCRCMTVVFSALYIKVENNKSWRKKMCRMVIRYVSGLPVELFFMFCCGPIWVFPTAINMIVLLAGLCSVATVKIRARSFGGQHWGFPYSKNWLHSQRITASCTVFGICEKLIHPFYKNVSSHDISRWKDPWLISLLRLPESLSPCASRKNLIPRCLIGIGANALLLYSSQGPRVCVINLLCHFIPWWADNGICPLAAYHQEFPCTFHSHHSHCTWRTWC